MWFSVLVAASSTQQRECRLPDHMPPHNLLFRRANPQYRVRACPLVLLSVLNTNALVIRVNVVIEIGCGLSRRMRERRTRRYERQGRRSADDEMRREEQPSKSNNPPSQKLCRSDYSSFRKKQRQHRNATIPLLHRALLKSHPCSPASASLRHNFRVRFQSGEGSGQGMCNESQRSVRDVAVTEPTPWHRQR